MTFTLKRINVTKAKTLLNISIQVW